MKGDEDDWMFEKERFDNYIGDMELEKGLLKVIRKAGRKKDLDSVLQYPAKVNSYLRDVMNIGMYSEGDVPVAETEDDLASKSIPDENPRGIGRMPTVIESATCKRRDSFEDSFDIITDEEAREVREATLNRFTGYAPVNIYQGGYPGAGNEANVRPAPNFNMNFAPQYQQPVPVYVPPPPLAYQQHHQCNSNILNWGFGIKNIRRIANGPRNHFFAGVRY
uniref:Uncharacterized protein n=1 Tax=Euplotes harpa TaxID=151035 RepID=A0A7S3N9Y9_9SPIT|mmetsp:Transcript_28541/g.32623  ORF Transcript_28541/g.32623 Transcript_28541/m.32623 type:complete len:221 (+) Transcript_28541:11-673(+)